MFARIDAFAAKFQTVPGLRHPLVRRGVLVLLLLLLTAFVVSLFATVAPRLPWSFWQVLLLCVLVGGVAWWFLRGAALFERRGSKTKRRGNLAPGDPAQEAEAVNVMRTAIEDAVATVRRSPDIGGSRNPLYCVPWYLFIGDEHADARNLLKTANGVSPFEPPKRAADLASPTWHWWFFKQMVAIETSPEFVCDESDRSTRGIWYRALELFRPYRSKMPLNGVVLVVSATDLVGNDEAFRNQCMRLRRLVDEVMEYLDVSFPVYFVVTGLDRLPGFEEFIGALASGVERQAFGERLDITRAGAASGEQIGNICDALVKRLHALRLTALCQEQRREVRKGIFEFVEAFQTLKPGLETFIRHLLEENPFLRTPRWRGLYFTATGEHPAFVADLFTRFLPVDQPLATRTDRGRLMRWSKAGIGGLAALALSGFLTQGVMVAHRQDELMDVSCAPNVGLSGHARVAWIADCGRKIDAYEAAEGGHGLGFGLRRSDARIAELKRILVNDFVTYILGPYDQAIRLDLDRRNVGLDHFLAVAQRLRMLDECRSNSTACRTETAAVNFIFDAQSRLFAPFDELSTAEAKERQGRELMRAYIGYVRWQKSDLLEQERASLKAVLTKLADLHPLQPEDVVRWADARRRPLLGADFWRPETPVATEDVSLSSAYTRPVWVEVVAPVVEQFGELSVEKKNMAAAFFDGYRRAYMDSWGTFLEKFPSGARLWVGHYDGLLTRANSAEGPYSRMWASLDDNIYRLPIALPSGTIWMRAWAGIKSDWTSTPSLVWEALRDFAGSRKRAGSLEPPIWVAAIAETRDGLLRAQRPLFTNAYNQLQMDASGKESYAVASELFKPAAGASPPPVAADYRKLLESVEKPPEKFEFRSVHDQTAWSVVQGPAKLLLLLTLHRASTFLQTKWQEAVVQPVRALPPSEQEAALRKQFDAYVNDWLKPFVTEKEHAPRQVEGVAFPLSATFKAVNDGVSGSVPLDPGKLIPAGKFRFEKPSTFGNIREPPGGTSLEVECTQRQFTVTSPGESDADVPVSVFWSAESCPEARLRVSVPAEPKSTLPSQDELVAMLSGQKQANTAPPQAPPQSIRLTKVYAGREGFRRLVEDFQTGAHTFQLNEFRGAYSAAQWSTVTQRAAALGINYVTVYLRPQLSDEMKNALYPPAPQKLPVSIFD